MKMRFLVGSALFLFPGVALAQEGPSFSRDVQPFLQKYCMECHRSGKVKGGLNLESYESMMKGSKRGRKVVVPGQPDQSRLVWTLEHQMKPYMPPRKSPQPTEKEIAVLRAWIKAGAKNDTAKSAFQIRKTMEQEKTEKTEGVPLRISANHKGHQEHKGKLTPCVDRPKLCNHRSHSFQWISDCLAWLGITSVDCELAWTILTTRRHVVWITKISVKFLKHVQFLVVIDLRLFERY